MAQRLVVLSPSTAGPGSLYTVRVGPLRFVTPADTVSETIGDGLVAVGAGLAPAQRQPRPLKLKLPVRGHDLELDAPEAGRVLRRQVRAVLDNAAWRLTGFYHVWEADPDLDGWLLIGAGELSENDPGISFGDFGLELSDVYIRGRPGTHRPGRRASIGDRRDGLIPRDSRRLLYSTDFSSQPLPDEPIAIPGDVVDLVASGNRPPGATTPGPERGFRRLWRTAAGNDGEILTYLPDEALLNDRYRYLDLEDLGAVRVWDLSNAVQYPPSPGNYTAERDTDPDILWGWTRVLGDVLQPNLPLAMDNGACRVVWLGSAANQGLAIEYWDDTFGHFVRAGRVLHALGVREQRVVECTPERSVIEWRAGQYALRAILQRGWWGPRLESYDDGGGTAHLDVALGTGGDGTIIGDELIIPFLIDGAGPISIEPQTPAWVYKLTSGGPDVLWATGSADEVVDDESSVITGEAASFQRARVIVAQVSMPPGPTASELASLSLVDARPVPVLVGRR